MRAATAPDRAHSVDEALFWMPTIAQRPDSTEWERRFAEAMAAKGRRRNWRPTAKQLATMRRLAERLFYDVNVIEAD